MVERMASASAVDIAFAAFPFWGSLPGRAFPAGCSARISWTWFSPKCNFLRVEPGSFKMPGGVLEAELSLWFPPFFFFNSLSAAFKALGLGLLHLLEGSGVLHLILLRASGIWGTDHRFKSRCPRKAWLHLVLRVMVPRQEGMCDHSQSCIHSLRITILWPSGFWIPNPTISTILSHFGEGRPKLWFGKPE